MIRGKIDGLHVPVDGHGQAFVLWCGRENQGLTPSTFHVARTERLTLSTGLSVYSGKTTA